MQILPNYETFQTVLHKPLIVVLAKTENCSVCKPVLARLTQLLTKFPDVPAYQIDVERIETFRGQHLVFTVPTVMIFELGKEILRESRFVDFAKIERLLELYTS
jgi:thiol-disulfide isomerase/thioredoxin